MGRLVQRNALEVPDIIASTVPSSYYPEYVLQMEYESEDSEHIEPLTSSTHFVSYSLYDCLLDFDERFVSRISIDLLFTTIFVTLILISLYATYLNYN